jgi:hypothetical protein
VPHTSIFKDGILMFLASIRMFALRYTYFTGIARTGLHRITLHQGWQKVPASKKITMTLLHAMVIA